MKAAETRFTPEFRNRIDEIIVFSPLTMDEVREIARLYLGKFERNMERQGKIVEITDAAIDLLPKKASARHTGALPETPHRPEGETSDHQSVEDRDEVHR